MPDSGYGGAAERAPFASRREGGGNDASWDRAARSGSTGVEKEQGKQTAPAWAPLDGIIHGQDSSSAEYKSVMSTEEFWAFPELGMDSLGNVPFVSAFHFSNAHREFEQCTATRDGIVMNSVRLWR